MKKLLALLLALVMVFALAACGGSSDAAEEETTETVEAADAAEADDAAPTDEEVAAEGEIADAGDASGEIVAPEDEEEASQEQSLELFPMDGYDKTFDGYIQWVRDALNSQEGNPNLESDLAELDEVTEDSYSADAMPFQMQIQFGLILSYEDFLNS